MESLPSLPESPELRAFVIWASAGVLGIFLGISAAASQKRWDQAGRSAVPLAVGIVGFISGNYIDGAHTWAMWIAVLAACWAAHRNSGFCSFMTFLGGLGLAAAGLLARSLF